MQMVGMEGAGTRPGRVIRARHVEKSWPARASRNETLVETAAGGPSRSGPCATPHRSSATVSPERPSPICPARRRRSADSDELRGSPHCSRRARAWSWKKRKYDSTEATGETPSEASNKLARQATDHRHRGQLRCCRQRRAHPGRATASTGADCDAAHATAAASTAAAAASAAGWG